MSYLLSNFRNEKQRDTLCNSILVTGFIKLYETELDTELLRHTKGTNVNAVFTSAQHCLV